MAASIPDVVSVIHQPEYTGENRCIPCTIVNLVIAIIGAGVVTVLLPLSLTGSIVVGIGLFLVSLIPIYYRGYLVPGTPWFTRTYFPDWLLRVFDEYPVAEPPPVDEDFDPEGFLKQLGVVTECEDVDDLCLTNDFYDSWYGRIEELRANDTTKEDLAMIVGMDESEIEFKEYGSAFVAYSPNGGRFGQWESRAAFLADMAAARELRTRFRRWREMNVEQRSSLLHGLRIFIDWCPICDGRVIVDQEVVESCCRSIDVVAATCQDCESRLFEAEQPA